VNALTHPQVGQYVNRHFVSAFQKVATFQVNGGQKQGGNVAAYFCTSEGLVLHAIAGPVDADTFLREARWANETYQLAQLEGAAGVQTLFRQAHLDRLVREHNFHLRPDGLPKPAAVTSGHLEQALRVNAGFPLNNTAKTHLVLAVGPLLRVGQVYRVVFEKILGEKISADPVAQR
jgi:hypothetical protein